MTELDPQTGQPYTEEQRAALEEQRAAEESADKGDGPSSHETSGTFPADEVAATHGDPVEVDEDDKGDGPSSHETSGDFPAEEVASTHAAAATETDDRNRALMEAQAKQHAEQHAAEAEDKT